MSGRGDNQSSVPWVRAGGLAVLAIVGVVGVGLVRSVAVAHPAVTNAAPQVPQPRTDVAAAASIGALTTEPRPAPDVEPSVDATPPTATTSEASTPTPTLAPACRAAVLVHGGGYFMGDHDTMKADFTDPLTAAGFTVDSVDYPLLGAYPTIKIDPAHSWYPRNDLTTVPAPM